MSRAIYSIICLLVIGLYLSCEIDNNENIVPPEKNSDSSLIVIYNDKIISPDETNITIFLPIGSNVSSVSFILEVGKGATLQDGNDADLPLNESNQYNTNMDFSGGSTHDFKVTAQNGSITIYTVRVQLRDSKEIISFTFLRKDNTLLDTNITMDIAAPSIAKTVTNVKEITQLIPTIIHNGSNISPTSGVPQNFSTNNTYMVTAFDGNISTYTVSLTNYYGVTINTNGGSITGAPTTTEYVLYGEKATLPSDPSQEHYGFKGWYDSPVGGNLFDFNTPITTQTIVYAQWTNKQYQVRFYRGASLLRTVPVASLTTISALDYPVNPNAGKADRWHSNANLGGVFNKDFLLIADVNLYAQEVQASFEMIIENRMIPTDLINYGKMSEEIFSNYTSGAIVISRYVKETASGTGDGSSWFNAANDIQAMIDGITDASENKIYIVLIASGVYKQETYFMKNHVAIVGGFAVGRYDQSGETLLDGDNDKRVFHNYNLDRTALLYGVIITNGNSGDSGDNGSGMYNASSSPTLINVTFSGNEAQEYGGGMFNYLSSPTLINITFLNNSAYNYGGGMLNDSSSPTLINITFLNNFAYNYGGGMFNWESSPTLNNITFSNNIAEFKDGGGMYNWKSSPTLNNVTFSGNGANTNGGGMVNAEHSFPILNNVVFSGNTGNHSGGGMFNENSSPILNNVTFSGNVAQQYGGGMYNWKSSPTLINTTFSGNIAKQYGGGMFNYLSSPTLINAVFLGNIANTGAGGIYHNSRQPLTLINTILWGNNNGQIYLDNNNTNTETINLYYSLIEGGTTPSTTATGIRLFQADTNANPISIVSKEVIDENPERGILANYGGKIDTISIGNNSPAKDKGVYVKGVKAENIYPEANLYYSENNTDWYSDPGLTTQESPPSDADDLTTTDARGYGRVGRPDMGAYEVGGIAP